jgi:hypothetical protein
VIAFIKRRVAALAERALDVLFDRRTYELNGDPYLTRWFVWPRRAGDTPEDQRGSAELYVHRFHRSDGDRHLHNHPFAASVAFILWGGYREDREAPLYTRVMGPGRVNFITSRTYHRVTLLGRSSWSLFFVGPRVQPWGFLVNGSHVPKDEYRRLFGGEGTE